MIRLPTMCRFVCAVTLPLFVGLAYADTVTLQAVKDNTLYEPIQQDGLELYSNGAGHTMFVGKTKDALNQAGQVAVRRAVLAFDIASNIPAGSTIDSVTLQLRCTKVGLNTSFNVRLHELQRDWGEGTSNTGNSQQGRGEPATTGDATWEHTFYDTLFWVTLGGDYAGTASATRAVGGTGNYTWGSTAGMVGDVQNWLDNPSQNFGWILVGDESQPETAKQFATRENTDSGGAYKPKLIVDYTPLLVSGGCCQGPTCTIETPANCATAGGAYQGDGSSCSPNPCVQPFGACCASNGTCTEDTQSDCEGRGDVFQADGSTCATVECPIQLTPYVDPLPVPGPATPVSGSAGGAASYSITIKEFQQQLHSELPLTTVWGYDDGTGPGTPGPLIEARSGQPVTVDWINDLRELGTGNLRTDHYLEQSSDDLSCTHGAQDQAKTVVHLHGGHVPAEVDGYPESTSLPGAPAETYAYPNTQQAAPLWFHDHALGITRLNVYMGLAGLYLLRDDVEDAINLPSGAYEIPLVLQDRKFNPDGSLFYPGTWQDHFFGDKVMVNGKVWPYLDVDKGKYRFRVLNGSGSRVYTLSLNPPSGTLTFTVIGNEGGLLEQPAHSVSALTIGPGERYDVVVDFASFANNDEILLQNSAPAPFPDGTLDVTQVMKFVVKTSTGDTDPIPSTLRNIERLQEADAVMTRDFELKKSGLDACGRSYWEINGLHWDDITEYPELGTTEIWRFINDSGVSHPMHMHLVAFQILDRDGFTRGAGGEIIPDGNPQSPPPEESGWKDTAMVGPDEILRIIARFDDYTGKYAYHCHILEHEDHEMMRQFQTIECGNGSVEPTEECDDGNTAEGDCCDSGCRYESAGSLCTDDGNVCTDDVCDAAGTCLHQDNTAACDDDVYCNGADTCGGGSCSVHGGDPCPGADGDGNCSESCDESADNCLGPDPNGSACDDALYCNGADTCGGGSCSVHGNDPCPGADGDGNCSESCDESADNCLGPDPNGSACDDSLFCTLADTCSSGTCTGVGDPCAVGSECADSCNENTDDCFDAAGTACADDGNVCTDDECDGFGACEHPFNTGFCDDGSACTNVDVCSGGVCIGSLPPECEDSNPCTQDTCDDIDGCLNLERPATDCFVGQRAQLLVRDRSVDDMDRLMWKWQRGVVTLQEDFGNPDTTTSYALCVYDSVGGESWLATMLEIPANGAWLSKDPRGWLYKDNLFLEDGVQQIKLKPGAVDGKSLARVKARGVNLPLPAAVGATYFAQDPEVALQLHNSEGRCWTSVFTTNRGNTPEKFKAKTP